LLLKIQLNFKIMKINLKCEIKGIDNKSIINPQTNQARTLKSVMIGALLFPKGRRNPQTGAIEQEEDSNKEKFEKYRLYEKIQNANKEIELTTDEISKIKKLIGEIEPQLVMGQCWVALEGGTK